MASAAKSKSRRTKSHHTPTESYTPRSTPRPAGTAKNRSKALTLRAPGIDDVLDGKYHLLGLLGAGGMGSVYEAEHLGTGRKVAIKVLHSSLATIPDEVDRFYREGQIDNRVDSRVPRAAGPGAVAALDDGVTESGAPYLVLDKLDGETLESARRRVGGRMAPREVERVLDDALLTLEGAHQEGIVHRDLKPENLFLTRDGSTRVLDWGLAQVPGERSDPGTYTGTPGFAPPEQALGLRATPASDTWGAGAAAYRLLTGHTPLHPGDAHAAGEAYLRSLPKDFVDEMYSGQVEPTFSSYPGCPVPPVRSKNPAVPAELAAVVDRALSCDPARRYPDAMVMREDLRRAMEEELLRTVLATG